MSRSVLFLLLLLILWILFGAWLCNKYICNPNGAAAAAGPCDGSWSIEHKSLDIEASDFIKFNKSGDTHIRTSASVNSLLDATADFLKKNSSEKLNITGYYDNSESYGTGENALYNLGQARANDVMSLLTSRGVPANQLSTSVGYWEDDECLSGNTLVRGATFNFN